MSKLSVENGKLGFMDFTNDITNEFAAKKA